MNNDKLNLIGGLQLQPQLDPLTGTSRPPSDLHIWPFPGAEHPHCCPLTLSLSGREPSFFPELNDGIPQL